MAFENRHTRIIIAGGGTGGHIFPGLAIAGALRKTDPDIEILFVGALGKMEIQKVPEAGFEIKGIEIAGYNRSSILKNLVLPYKLLKSYFQVRSIFNQFHPDAVIGVGGYSSFPVLRLAQSKGIPTFIHESNSLPGKSNLWLGKKATKIFVASDGMEKYFPASKIRVSGNPVRDILRSKASRTEALQFFGLRADRKTLLVVGGSLGARSINQAIAKSVDGFRKNQWQLIWQTGKNFSPDAARQEEEHSNIWTNAFIDRMEMAYAAADVVLARAGAMTIAELIAQEKAAVLVPYPFAAENHQTVNARYLVDKNAAILIPDAAISDRLMEVVTNLMQDDSKIHDLEKNIATLQKADAASFIAHEILSDIKK